MEQDSQARTNLEAAASIEQSTGWMKARYIASSVETQPNGGDRRSDQIVSDNLKLTLTDSANVLRMGTRTVKKYLDTWDTAASDGHCQPSGWLTPADGDTAVIPAEDLWPKYWEREDESKEPTGSSPFEKAMKNLKAFSKNANTGLTPAEREALSTEAVNILRKVGGPSWKH